MFPSPRVIGDSSTNTLKSRHPKDSSSLETQIFNRKKGLIYKIIVYSEV